MPFLELIFYFSFEKSEILKISRVFKDFEDFKRFFKNPNLDLNQISKVLNLSRAYEKPFLTNYVHTKLSIISLLGPQRYAFPS